MMRVIDVEAFLEADLSGRKPTSAAAVTPDRWGKIRRARRALFREESELDSSVSGDGSDGFDTDESDFSDDQCRPTFFTGRNTLYRTWSDDSLLDMPESDESSLFDPDSTLSTPVPKVQNSTFVASVSKPVNRTFVNASPTDGLAAPDITFSDFRTPVRPAFIDSDLFQETPRMSVTFVATPSPSVAGNGTFVAASVVASTPVWLDTTFVHPTSLNATFDVDGTPALRNATFGLIDISPVVGNATFVAEMDPNPSGDGEEKAPKKAIRKTCVLARIAQAIRRFLRRLLSKLKKA